jgi:ribose-phosphate pyrophosphokinase
MLQPHQSDYKLYGKLVLLSGTANPGLADEIAAYLECALMPREIKCFANDNTFVKLGASVRGADVFFIQPTCPPTNDHLMELLIAIDALRRDSAGRITAVVPYYGYGRSDKKDQPRVPITARLVADMLTVAGADRLLTSDLHADQIQGFFSIPVDDVTAQHMLADHVKKLGITNGVVVSPDLGNAKDARNFADEIDMPLALVEKRRSRDGSLTEVLNLIGDVEGKDVLLVDDEIDTAGTIVRAAKFVKARGAARVYAMATHGIFSPPAIDQLRDAPIDEIVVTNTVPIPPQKRLPNMRVLSMGELLGEVIRRIHTGQSVGEMFNE